MLFHSEGTSDCSIHHWKSFMRLHMALFLILIEIMLNMGCTEDVSSTLGSTLFQQTKQRNVTTFVKLVCCQDFLLLFLTFSVRIVSLNSKSVFNKVSSWSQSCSTLSWLSYFLPSFWEVWWLLFTVNLIHLRRGNLNYRIVGLVCGHVCGDIFLVDNW